MIERRIAITTFGSRFEPMCGCTSTRILSCAPSRIQTSWKHSGSNLDAGAKPVASDGLEGRLNLAEYLLRAPFSLEKITWNEKPRKVIYRSSRSWRTRRNFQIFDAGDFLASAIQHIPPNYQQTVRYYGVYSNKTRGMARKGGEILGHPAEGPGDPQGQPDIIAAPRHASSRPLRPLWRQLIERIWGVDPLICPCCKGTMRRVGTIEWPKEIDVLPAPPRPLGGRARHPAATRTTLRRRKTPKACRRFGQASEAR